ncbi:molting protein mlt-4 [Anaeramoeba ignava]|uniref:Molting protein mlt-4 n=1 Tax=Anaeramoeba ignava TaxID=1746090 RepID=A0A9Q0R6Z0_ANAIG|nr:molting protein mlt-4 [Anaeramoeba ignava]
MEKNLLQKFIKQHPEIAKREALFFLTVCDWDLTKANELNRISQRKPFSLLRAISTRDIFLLTTFLQNKEDPNETIPNGDSALILAIKDEQLDSIKLLLNNGANPNQICNHKTALHIAVEQDSVPIVKILLKFKADPKIVNDKGLYPIQQTNSIFMISHIRKFIDGYFPNFKENINEETQFIHKLSPNNITLNQVDNLFQYLLHPKMIPYVKTAINSGFKLDILWDNNGKTLLYYACYQSNYELVDFLMTKYPESQNTGIKEVELPMEIALSKEDLRLFALLLLHGNKTTLNLTKYIPSFDIVYKWFIKQNQITRNIQLRHNLENILELYYWINIHTDITIKQKGKYFLQSYGRILSNPSFLVDIILEPVDSFTQDSFSQRLKILHSLNSHENFTKFIGYFSTTHRKKKYFGFAFKSYKFSNVLSLGSFIKTNEEYPERKLLEILRGIVQGMMFIQDDLNKKLPESLLENIQADENCVPKISSKSIDFGYSTNLINSGNFLDGILNNLLSDDNEKFSVVISAFIFTLDPSLFATFSTLSSFDDPKNREKAQLKQMEKKPILTNLIYFTHFIKSFSFSLSQIYQILTSFENKIMQEENFFSKNKDHKSILDSMLRSPFESDLKSNLQSNEKSNLKSNQKSNQKSNEKSNLKSNQKSDEKSNEKSSDFYSFITQKINSSKNPFQNSNSFYFVLSCFFDWLKLKKQNFYTQNDLIIDLTEFLNFISFLPKTMHMDIYLEMLNNEFGINIEQKNLSNCKIDFNSLDEKTENILKLLSGTN